MLDLCFQGMVENVDLKEQGAHKSYKDRVSKYVNKQLLCKSKQYAYLFSNEN